MAESYKYPSAIKRRLEPAHRELVHRGFLSLGLRGVRPGRHQVQRGRCEAHLRHSSFGRPGQTLLGLMIRVMSWIISHEPGISAPEFSITTIVIRSDGR